MRRQILSRELDQLGAAALVVVAGSSRDPDLAPFVGTAHFGHSVLVWPARGEPRLAFLTPMERDEAASTGLPLATPEELEIERLYRELHPVAIQAAILEKTLALAGVAPGRAVLAGRAGAGVVHAACARLEKRGWSFLAGEEVIRHATQRKDETELAAVRHAAAGTMAALRRVAALLASVSPDPSESGDPSDLWLGGERLRAGRLRAEIAVELARFGLAEPLGSIVAPAEVGAVPHNQGDDERVLRSRESLIVDLFPQRRVFADCTRTFCVGPPAPELAAAHRAVSAALAAARLAARPGVRGWALQEAACTRLGAAGYPTPLSHPGTTVGYVHGLGHGVGYELHEYPSFRKQAGREGVLREGDVFTLEPGLYDPTGGWAVRLEDLCALSADGLEVLTPLPYELDPAAWGA